MKRQNCLFWCYTKYISNICLLNALAMCTKFALFFFLHINIHKNTKEHKSLKDTLIISEYPCRRKGKTIQKPISMYRKYKEIVKTYIYISTRKSCNI